jgi:hypothetical protein
MTFDDVLLRWTIGSQDTVTLANFDDTGKYADFLWLAKFSIRSFQSWFPGARFVVLYNGVEFEDFIELFDCLKPELLFPVEYINQCSCLSEGVFQNPYHFYPLGVWWKWIPFRLDISKHEIAVDTDIICINEPYTWYDWLNDESTIVVAPERYEVIKVNTCGDLYKQPLLRGRKPANCGVVGQKKNCNFEERFFEIAQRVRFGYTHDSLFITEQGVVNLWIYSLQIDNQEHLILDFKKNAWIRDFLYFLKQGVKVETVHAVSWHKSVAKELKETLEMKVLDPEYDDMNFVQDMIQKSQEIQEIGKLVIGQQIEQELRSDFLIKH